MGDGGNDKVMGCGGGDLSVNGALIGEGEEDGRL